MFGQLEEAKEQKEKKKTKKYSWKNIILALLCMFFILFIITLPFFIFLLRFALPQDSLNTRMYGLELTIGSLFVSKIFLNTT